MSLPHKADMPMTTSMSRMDVSVHDTWPPSSTSRNAAKAARAHSAVARRFASLALAHAEADDEVPGPGFLLLPDGSVGVRFRTREWRGVRGTERDRRCSPVRAIRLA